MKNKRIIFWQETPSPHQAPWIRALAELVPDSDIVVVCQQSGLSPDRIALGWQPPDFGNVRTYISPDKERVDQLIECDESTTTHVFSSMLENPHINKCFQRALSSKATVGVLSEGRDWRGWKGMARRACKAPREYAYSDSVDFVLAMGSVGLQWFKRSGFDSGKLYPFCYVVESPDVLEMPCDDSKSTLQLMAVGQLIKRKRFDLLLKALKQVPERGWKLKIVGDGILRRSLEKMAIDLGLGERVVFTGVLNNAQVRSVFFQTDVFFLNSHWDGWGAVVNEALMSGVPVVCSDYCGAADLIVPGFNGAVFESGNVESLAKIIQKFMEYGRLPLVYREQIRTWSRCIEGPRVAGYFLDVLKFVDGTVENRPVPPWSV
jgi:glycosyltransferase involved in cell wall biosynthesis